MTNILNTRRVRKFSAEMVKRFCKLYLIAFMRPRDIRKFSHSFADLYSVLLDFAEHSISSPHFELPTEGSNQSGIVASINQRLARLYGAEYARLSYGGSSGTILTILASILPKIYYNRKIILVDELAHQSTMGGLILGRWKFVAIPRTYYPKHGTHGPVHYRTVKALIEEHGAKNIAAVFLVAPSYGGFRHVEDETAIYTYTKARNIMTIIDGAWGSTIGLMGNTAPLLITNADIVITSPHKRGLTPSSLGCLLTSNKRVAELWDEAGNHGFSSTSISFVQMMVAEHRMEQIENGEWDELWQSASRFASILRSRIKEVHTDLYVVDAEHVGATHGSAAHVLISRASLNINAVCWAKVLSAQFHIDVEKATPSTLLLLCGPSHNKFGIECTLGALCNALHLTLKMEASNAAIA